MLRQLPREVDPVKTPNKEIYDGVQVGDEVPPLFEKLQEVEKIVTTDEQSLQDLDRQVEMRYIVGKFKGKMKIDDEEWIDDAHVDDDYETYPKSMNRFLGIENRLFVGGEGNFDWLFHEIKDSCHNHGRTLPGDVETWDTLSIAYSNVPNTNYLVDVAMYMPVLW